MDDEFKDLDAMGMHIEGEDLLDDEGMPIKKPVTDDEEEEDDMGDDD
jgi:hypothetical protein